jgi:hypothetical protein
LPRVHSRSVSSSSPISLFLVSNSTIIARTQSYGISLELSMPSSWVMSECSIHRVQYTPKIFSHPVVILISSWTLNVASGYTVPHHWSTTISQFVISASQLQSPGFIPTVSS